mgnify:CR=1 FL=1
MRLYRYLFIALLLSLAPFAAAEQLLMARVNMTFPEAMLKLQETIKQQGYTISRVQRVDIGLTKSGYKTDKYRVVFFGKAEETEQLTKKFPVLLPYFPLKIAIFAEGNDTLITAYDPLLMFGESEPLLARAAQKWRSDLEVIFSTMREAE